MGRDSWAVAPRTRSVVMLDQIGLGCAVLKLSDELGSTVGSQSGIVVNVHLGLPGKIDSLGNINSPRWAWVNNRSISLQLTNLLVVAYRHLRPNVPDRRNRHAGTGLTICLSSADATGAPDHRDLRVHHEADLGQVRVAHRHAA